MVRLAELTQLSEAKYDYSLDDYEKVPYDTNPSAEIAKHNRASFNEPHIGPHEGKYLNLMLKGMKPATIIFDEPEYTELFAPYIKSGKIVVAGKFQHEIFLTLPGEEWRGRKLQEISKQSEQLYKRLQAGERINWDVEEYEKNRDAQVGMLLGYPKESIRNFLSTRYQASKGPIMRMDEIVAPATANLNKLHDREEYETALASFKEYYGDKEGEAQLTAYSNALDSVIQNGGMIYRAVWVLPGKKPRLRDPGQHWTVSVESAINYLETETGDIERTMAIPDDSDEEPVPYILGAKVGPNNVTNKDVQIAYFPWEQEVRLINRSAAKISVVKILDDYVV